MTAIMMVSQIVILRYKLSYSGL